MGTYNAKNDMIRSLGNRTPDAKHKKTSTFDGYNHGRTMGLPQLPHWNFTVEVVGHNSNCRFSEVITIGVQKIIIAYRCLHFT